MKSERILPLFPLEIVVFPNSPLPLHIFEPRYQEMIRDCLSESKEFGIVYAHSKGMAEVGTSVRIENVLQRFPDGRLNILCMGKKRFTIHDMNEERSFLQARVSFWDDIDLESDSLQSLSQETKRVLDDYSRITGRNTQSELFDTYDPQALSYLLADIVPYELTKRQKLLENRSCVERLTEVNAGLRRLNQRLAVNGKLQGFFHNSRDYSSIVN